MRDNQTTEAATRGGHSATGGGYSSTGGGHSAKKSVLRNFAKFTGLRNMNFVNFPVNFA